MYKQIIYDAVNVGYKGLNYYKYDRDDFYYASNIIAMSDDYLKFKSGYKKSNEEYYLGLKRTYNDVTSNNKDNKLLPELLKLTGKHKLFDDTIDSTENTILSDVQAIYYIVAHIYQKALDIIGENDAYYKTINAQPLSNCLIEKEKIDNLSAANKNKLRIMIFDLFTSHRDLSKHFDEMIKKISILGNFDNDNLENVSITEFMETITQLKKEIENVQSNILLERKNEIIKLKNMLNALQYLKENDKDSYLKYEEDEIVLRNKLKELLKQTYIFFYNNKNIFRFYEIISYFKDILLDPQSLSSTNDESKSLCEELYEEIINELDNNGINEIDDNDEFKIFTMRVSATSFGLYKLLYTYEHNNPLCRLEVYSDMISRIFGKDEKKLIIKSINQIIKTKIHSTYDSVMCFSDNIRAYVNSMDLNENVIEKLIRDFYSINYLDTLTQTIPDEYLEIFEEKIISLMNDGKINSSDITAREIYKQLIKRQ